MPLDWSLSDFTNLYMCMWFKFIPIMGHALSRVEVLATVKHVVLQNSYGFFNQSNIHNTKTLFEEIDFCFQIDCYILLQGPI